MKIAFAGKGGAGKTSLAAWMADWLSRRGEDVILVDADTAVSLGQASGLPAADLPVPLSEREDLVMERIGQGVLNLTPDVSDLPEAVSVELPGEGPGAKRLLVMGRVISAGAGCACGANTLLRAVLHNLVTRKGQWVLVDLEAGVEHLGRGSVQHVDAMVVVSEPSYRSLETAAAVGRLAREMGVTNQALVMNRLAAEAKLPELDGLPPVAASVPVLTGLIQRQLDDASVLGLPERDAIDAICKSLVERLVERRLRRSRRWLAGHEGEDGQLGASSGRPSKARSTSTARRVPAKPLHFARLIRRANHQRTFIFCSHTLVTWL